MGNILYENIVMDVSEELVPYISIAALDRKKFSPQIIKDTPKIDNYFHNRFGEKYTLCIKAREAIYVVLKNLKLQPDDVVTILTTTGNSYISGCVTKAIERVCKWSREFTPNTKAIFVNHEFGYAYENLDELKKYNLPIIEDCAHSFFTTSKDIGKVGDYVIYSLPKAFSTQLGSVIVYRDHLDYQSPTRVNKYIKSALEPQIESIEDIINKRFENYQYYSSHLKDIGITPYFRLKKGDVPGVFMFKWNKKIKFCELKDFLNRNGVDSSVYFGQNAYFVPIHHNLSSCEMDYIIGLIRYFGHQIE